jgi:hypothetical protein
MASNRLYTWAFDNASFTTSVIDAWYLKAGTANGLELHSFSITAGVTTPTIIRLKLVRLAPGGGSFTAPSGGSTVTVNATNCPPVDSGDVLNVSKLAALTYVNTSAGAANTGSLVVTHAWQWETMGELLYLPPPEDRPVIQPGEALELQLGAAFLSTTPCSGYVQWRELP